MAEISPSRSLPRALSPALPPPRSLAAHMRSTLTVVSSHSALKGQRDRRATRNTTRVVSRRRWKRDVSTLLRLLFFSGSDNARTSAFVSRDCLAGAALHRRSVAHGGPIRAKQRKQQLLMPSPLLHTHSPLISSLFRSSLLFSLSSPPPRSRATPAVSPTSDNTGHGGRPTAAATRQSRRRWPLLFLLFPQKRGAWGCAPSSPLLSLSPSRPRPGRCPSLQRPRGQRAPTLHPRGLSCAPRVGHAAKEFWRGYKTAAATAAAALKARRTGRPGAALALRRALPQQARPAAPRPRRQCAPLRL